MFSMFESHTSVLNSAKWLALIFMAKLYGFDQPSVDR